MRGNLSVRKRIELAAEQGYKAGLAAGSEAAKEFEAEAERYFQTLQVELMKATTQLGAYGELLTAHHGGSHEGIKLCVICQGKLTQLQAELEAAHAAAQPAKSAALFVTPTLADEAAASVRLDGETHCVDEPTTQPSGLIITDADNVPCDAGSATP